MASFQELYIQSNIPLIIITISLICISIIGFLEFKKQSNKLNQLSNEIEQLKTSRNVVEDKKIDDSKQIKKTKLKEKVNENLEKKEKEEEVLQKEPFEKENLQEELSQMIGGIQMGSMGPPEGDILFEVPPVMGAGGIANMIIGGPIMSMGGANVEHMFESQTQDIDNENQFEEIDMEDNNIIEEDIENESNKLENEDNDFSESENESDNESEFSESSEECSSEGSVSEEESDKIELVQGKGKVEEIKEIDRSLSIKELKEICQKLGLSSSGNKETLIKRINNKK